MDGRKFGSKKRYGEKRNVSETSIIIRTLVFSENKKFKIETGIQIQNVKWANCQIQLQKCLCWMDNNQIEIVDIINHIICKHSNWKSVGNRNSL